MNWLKNRFLKNKILHYGELASDESLTPSERKHMAQRAIDLRNGKFSVDDKIEHYENIILFPEGKSVNQIIYAQKRLSALKKNKRG